MIAIRVIVRVEGVEHPPSGAPMRVEVRDVTYEDAEAIVVGSAVGRVAASPAEPSLVAELTVTAERAPEVATVWAHVDVDGDGRVSTGDYITKRSFPVPSDGGRIVVVVEPVTGSPAPPRRP